MSVAYVLLLDFALAPLSYRNCYKVVSKLQPSDWAGLEHLSVPLFARSIAVAASAVAVAFTPVGALFASGLIFNVLVPLHTLDAEFLSPLRKELDFRETEFSEPTFLYPDSECPICLDAMASKSSAAETRCGHVFHSRCLRLSLLQKPACPMCRAIVGEQRQSIRL